MENRESYQKLIMLLQLAYSGELAAAYAYQGHSHSVCNPEEKRQITKIKQEELHHRRVIGELLLLLGAKPKKRLEFRNFVIGRIIGLLCHVSGWFFAMYGAGFLERKNIMEYWYAAEYARGCGQENLIDCLLTMSECEWDHESYFRSKIELHPLTRFFRLWEAPPPKEKIRESFSPHLLER